jgi:hypothetical protein
MPEISLFGGALEQFKSSVDKLVSLTEDEIGALGESFESLTVSLGSRDVEAVARAVHTKAPRLSEDEWETLAGLVLQLLTDSGFCDFLNSAVLTQADQRARLKGLRESLGSRPRIAETLAKNRFLEQGPRLKRLTWFCDLRTKFAKAGDGTPAGSEGRPQEELTLPIVTVRMAVDEIQSPIYFQLTDTELRDLISSLERAHKQLRYISEKLEKEKRGES